MNNFPYTVRNYQSTDFQKYVLLNIEAEKLGPAGRCVLSQVIAEILGRPNHSPEQDLFIVERAGNIVGYMDMTPELTIGRVILDCWIHPEHRRRGLATQLLSYAINRAKELGAKAVHVSIPQDNAVAKGVLSRLGFEFVRRFLELRLDMARVSWQDIDRAAQRCRHLRCGEEDKLTQIQNLSFAGHWGYDPDTVEAITYRINLSNCTPEDVVLTYDGDKVTGYCWTGITYDGEAVIGEGKGRILMLGTGPDYRGRGVGKRVLLAGLAYLKSKGLRVAELTVDSENEAACALYRSVGFEVGTSSLWYEKVLN